MRNVIANTNQGRHALRSRHMLVTTSATTNSCATRSTATRWPCPAKDHTTTPNTVSGTTDCTQPSPTNSASAPTVGAGGGE